MSVFRVNKNDNYTVMGNYHLRDINLSYKAKGLLSFMLSLPNNWDYSITGLCRVSKENMKAIRSTLHELEEQGYLKRTRVQNSKGHFTYDYSIYEQPYTQKGYAVEGDAQKDIQINTNKKDKNDKGINPLVKYLINRNFIDVMDTNIIFYDSVLEDVLTQYDYSQVAIVCDYIANKWLEIGGHDEYGNPIENKLAYFKTSLKNNLHKLNATVEFYKG